MRSFLAIAGIGCAFMAAAPLTASAADHEAGVPLAPAEAAGVWTVESGGRSICTVTLSAEKSGPGYGARASGACGDALKGTPAAWTSTGDGMALVDASGQSLIRFNRWSNSLFVSHTSSGVDVQLRRGGKPS